MSTRVEVSGTVTRYKDNDGTTDRTVLARIADAAFTITDEEIVEYATLSATRAVVLPLATTRDPDKPIVIKDGSGSASASVQITVTPSGTDTIDGRATYAIIRARGRVKLVPVPGAGRWLVVEESVQNRIFVSTEQTGNGGAQNVAHGLGVVPTHVAVYPTDTAPATTGAYTMAEGAHDATNVVATVTSGKKYKVLAIG